jgi:hypothetical protein
LENIMFQPTQAELISSLLIISGLLIWIILKRKANTEGKPGKA